jgi:hypothetical protein
MTVTKISEENVMLTQVKRSVFLVVDLRRKFVPVNSVFIKCERKA